MPGYGLALFLPLVSTWMCKQGWDRAYSAVRKYLDSDCIKMALIPKRFTQYGFMSMVCLLELQSENNKKMCNGPNTFRLHCTCEQ